MNTNPTTIPGDAGSIADDNSALGVDRARGSGPDADALGVLRHLPRAEPRNPEPDPAQAEGTVNEVIAALGLAKAATLAVSRARSHSPGVLGVAASLHLAGSINGDPELAGLRDDLADAALAHVDAILAGVPSVPTQAVADSRRIAGELDGTADLEARVAVAEARAVGAEESLAFAREGRDKAQRALLALGWDYSIDSGEWLAGRLDALPRDLALVAAAAVHELRNALLPVTLAATAEQRAERAKPAADCVLAAADELARVLRGQAPDGAPYAAAHLRGWADSMASERDPDWDLEVAAARMLAAQVAGDRSARIPEAVILAEAERIRRRDATPRSSGRPVDASGPAR